MATFTGGQSVKAGYFLNTREWKLEMVEPPFGRLPGDDDITYRRVPIVAMLVLAPLAGLAFVLLLPFIGLAVICEPAVRHLARRVAAAFPRHAAVRRATTVPRR